MGCEQGYEFVCEKCDKREFVEGDYNKSWILAEFHGWTFTDKGEICPDCSKNSKSLTNYYVPKTTGSVL